MRDFSKTDILFCAHGDRRGAQRNSNLKELAAKVTQQLNPHSCDIALLSEEGDLERKLDAASGSRFIIIPMIFSDGYFFNKITNAVNEPVANHSYKSINVMPPLCDWPELAQAINISFPLGPILLVAHGSKKSSASRLANERLADRLKQKYGRSVECAYLEEEPFAEESIQTFSEAINVVGLFMGEGLHGDEDWQAVLHKAKETPIRASTIGSMAELCPLVVSKIQCAIDDE